MISSQVMDDLMQAREIMQRVSSFRPKGWTDEEQQLFWEALERFPDGPWTSIAEYIGTKNTRQAMTFSQKVRQKLDRWRRKRTWAWQMVKANRAAKQQQIAACFPPSPTDPEGLETGSIQAATSTPLVHQRTQAPTPAHNTLQRHDSAEMSVLFNPNEMEALLDMCANWNTTTQGQAGKREHISTSSSRESSTAASTGQPNAVEKHH